MRHFFFRAAACSIWIIMTMMVFAGCSPRGAEETSGQSGPASQAYEYGKVEITYKLHHISKLASNQVAVWIEDTGGNYVKTLFATRFTAKGGYEKRDQALKDWVAASDLKNMAKEEVDAVSRATQKPGDIRLVWDCTDQAGKPVPAGKYIYKVEGNIFWENRVLYTGEIAIGDSQNNSVAEVHYIPETAKDLGILLEDVCAAYEPPQK